MPEFETEVEREYFYFRLNDVLSIVHVKRDESFLIEILQYKKKQAQQSIVFIATSKFAFLIIQFVWYLIVIRKSGK